MRYGSLILAVILLSPVSALADKPSQNDGLPPGLAKKGGVPPGLAKQGGLPPGLAKKGGVPPGLAKQGGLPPGLAKKGGVPPGLAKQGGLPPGLAKKFGPVPPQRAYIAFDPKRDDRAWFLIGDQWVLKQRFDPRLRVEVRRAMVLPPAPPPPVPLPPLNIEFRVVLFE